MSPMLSSHVAFCPSLSYHYNRSKSVFIEHSFKTPIPIDTVISTRLWVDIFIPPPPPTSPPHNEVVGYPGFILFIHRQSICHLAICHLSVIVQTITQILFFGLQPFCYMYHSKKNLGMGLNIVVITIKVPHHFFVTWKNLLICLIFLDCNIFYVNFGIFVI